jgi:hypothetical protein
MKLIEPETSAEPEPATDVFKRDIDSFNITLGVKIDCATSDGILSFNVKVEYPGTHPVLGEKRQVGISFEIPASVFPDDEKRDKWIEATKRNLYHWLIDVMREEARLFLGDVGNICLVKLGLDRATKRELYDMHMKATEKRLRVLFGMQGKGRRSRWTKVELAREVTASLRSLPVRRRTLDGAAASLKEKFKAREDADKIPPNGEALRQLLKRFGLDWDSLQPDD